MGSSKKQTVGYFYYKDLAGVLCHGPVDAITRIECSDRQIMRENFTESGPLLIKAGNVFGGKDREGGIGGTMDIMFGDDDQLPNTYMQSKISTAVNAMRGVVSVVWNRLYVGMNPYMRDFKYRVRRTNTGWYQEKSVINPHEVSATINSEYKYYVQDGLTSLSQLAAFAQTDFDDSDWIFGASPFGYVTASGLPPVNTTIMPKTGRSIMMREDIVVNNPSLIGDIFIKIRHDDGGAVYFNGEVFELTIDNQFNSTCTIPNSKIIHGKNVLFSAAIDAIPSGNNTGIYLSTEYYSDSNSVMDSDINPAHIIRDILTNKRYGLGVPEIKIDDIAFTKMADTLYSEKLGMSILWDGSSAIEDFLNTVCAHICATMPYVDSESGLWTCKLLRDDYDVDTLISLNEYNVIKCSEFTRKTMVDLINTVTVNYWDRETGDTSTVTVDNTARIAQQGKVIAQQVDYNGFTNSEIASRVALRDLKTLSTPLASATLDVTDVAASLKVGDCFKWSWSDYGLNNAIMRVSSIKKNGVLTNYFTIECIEDSYSMPMQSVLPYVPPPASNFDDAKPVDGILVEAPYFELVQRYGQTFVDQQLNAENESGYVLAVATTTQNTINADMNISSGGDFEEVGVVDLLPPCLTTQEINQMDSSFTVSDGSVFDSITIGSYFKINNELMRFDSIASNVVSVGRGVLDTIPQKHASGSKIFMVDEFSSIDETLYFEGQTIAGKLLTNTGSDVLELSEAPTITTVMNSRAFRPYPPANVKINGEYFPTEISGDLVLTWVDRNRQQQTGGSVIGWYEAGVTLESDVEYVVELYDADDVLISSTNVGALNTATVDYSAVTTATCTLKLYSIKNGYTSHQAFEHELIVSFNPPYNLAGIWNETTQTVDLTWEFDE